MRRACLLWAFFLGGMSVFHAFWEAIPEKILVGACPAGGLPAFVISVPGLLAKGPLQQTP